MAESIRETLVQYPSDKVTMRAYVAAPQTKERRPAIIVIQEWWGLTEHIKDVAKRYAAEGLCGDRPGFVFQIRVRSYHRSRRGRQVDEYAAAGGWA